MTIVKWMKPWYYRLHGQETINYEALYNKFQSGI